MMTNKSAAQKKPRLGLHPKLILLMAIMLPGSGHVATGAAQRGLVFVFFMLLFGYITYHLTTDDISFVGRYAGGFFIYALSITDAYKLAVTRRLKKTT